MHLQTFVFIRQIMKITSCVIIIRKAPIMRMTISYESITYKRKRGRFVIKQFTSVCICIFSFSPVWGGICFRNIAGFVGDYDVVFASMNVSWFARKLEGPRGGECNCDLHKSQGCNLEQILESPPRGKLNEMPSVWKLLTLQSTTY